MSVVTRGGRTLNNNADGQTQPVHTTIFRLSGTSPPGDLEPEMVYASGREAFAQAYVGESSYVVYPNKAEVFHMSLEPEVTRVVAVAQVVEPVGTAWYSVIDVPTSAKGAACAAKARGELAPMLCIELALQGYSILGATTTADAIGDVAPGSNCYRDPGR